LEKTGFPYKHLVKGVFQRIALGMRVGLVSLILNMDETIWLKQKTFFQKIKQGSYT
jgi:hypothetical protein